MSWLGKIMAFLVLVGVIVMVAFTVNVYAARTNWKVRADAYEKAYKDSEANRAKEMRDAEAGREAALRMYKAEKNRSDELDESLKKLSEAGRKVDADYAKLERDYRESDVQAKQLAASLERTQKEVKDTRDRNNTLEDRVQKLVIDKQNADRERVRAENEAKQARATADENGKQVERLNALVTELRQTGGSSTASILRNIDKIPSPLPENIRGTVLRDIQGDFVHISIGIDAGLEPGSKIDVYREAGGGKYLGTLVVTKSVYPKEAVAEFKPARGVPVSQLRPDELPRKGDTVGQLFGPGPR